MKVMLDLIARGAGVDPPDNNGRTPLMVAIDNNRLVAARSFIELGAEIEYRDNFSRTPLMYEM